MLKSIRTRLSLVLALSRLGRSLLGRLRVLACCAHYSVFPRLVRMRWTLPIVIEGRAIRLTVCSLAHLWSMRDIFVDREYAVDNLRDAMRIVDLGSNIGVSVAFFACRYPRARILAVEANPEIAELLRHNTAQFPNVTVVETAVGEKNGIADFFIGSRDTGASFWARTGASRKIVVQTRTLDDLIGSTDSIDLVKFDVEGAERYILPCVAALPVSHIIGEVHYDIAGITREWVADSLKDCKYSEKAIAPCRSILYADIAESS